jgi:hypothetical protein
MPRTIFALGSKAWAAQLAFRAATFPMDIARSTTCEQELIGFQSMVCGGGCGKAIIRYAGNPLGEAVVWYVSLRGNIEIRCFVPGRCRVSGVPTPLCRRMRRS